MDTSKVFKTGSAIVEFFVAASLVITFTAVVVPIYSGIRHQVLQSTRSADSAVPAASNRRQDQTTSSSLPVLVAKS